jgi:hypothetical protein
MKLKDTAKYLPFVQVLADGKIVEYQVRIKPTPTLRPWKPEEVPVGL